MRVRVRSSAFTPRNEHTGEEFDPTVVRAATNQKIANAMAAVLFEMDGLTIDENVIEFTFGRGDNAETYQVDKPTPEPVELEDAINLQEGPQDEDYVQYNEKERHDLLRLLDTMFNDAQRIIGQGEQVPGSMTSNAENVGVTAEFRKIYQSE